MRQYNWVVHENYSSYRIITNIAMILNEWIIYKWFIKGRRIIKGSSLSYWDSKYIREVLIINNPLSFEYKGS